MSSRFLIAVAVAVAAPAIASAQGFTDVKAKNGQPFMHRNSRIALPASLEGIERVVVGQLGTGELDVSARYDDKGEFLTVFVTRMVSGGIPVWFDRARSAVESRPEFGTVSPAIPTAAFTPPEQTVASGLAGAWATSGTAKGTMLALFPVGDWMVKVRYTSATHDGATLHARLPAILAALRLPRLAAPSAPAAEVAACATPLVLKGDARAVTDSSARMQGVLMGGLLAAATTNTARSREPAAPVTWCRDTTAVPIGGVYRMNAATNAYLIALGDSGRGLFITPDVAAAEIAAKQPGTLPRWLMSLSDMGRTLVYPPLDRLPPPTQALSLLQAGPPASVVTTWGKPKIEIDGNVVK